MHKWAGTAAAVALLVLGTTGAAVAAPGMGGDVKTPLTLDQATLSALPSTTLEVPYRSASGAGTDAYTGVLVWDLLTKAGLADETAKNAELGHTLLITSADGYVVAVAVGEFDPKYGNRPVLLAYKGPNDFASFDHLRLIVPGDLRSGRTVRDVASIEVK